MDINERKENQCFRIGVTFMIRSTATSSSSYLCVSNTGYSEAVWKHRSSRTIFLKSRTDNAADIRVSPPHLYPLL